MKNCGKQHQIKKTKKTSDEQERKEGNERVQERKGEKKLSLKSSGNQRKNEEEN